MGAPMPEWWMDFMMWLDTTYVPLWIVLSVFIAYFLWRFWHDLRVHHRPPPPFT